MNIPEQNNLDYYENLYACRHPLWFYLHGKISYDQKSKTRVNARVLRPVIENLVKHQGRTKVLDYGCGWGSLLLQLASNKIILAGYDISPGACRAVKRILNYFDFHTCDVDVDEKGSITPADWDIIISSHMLEHVSDDEAILNHMVKALKPGGYLLINVPVNEVCKEPLHVRAYTQDEICSKIKQAGLKIEKVIQCDRWTSFLRTHETRQGISAIQKICLRFLRLCLAVLPYTIVCRLENYMLKKYKPQQLVILGVKPL